MAALHKNKAAEIFNKYALSYQAQHMTVDKYQASLNLFCGALSRPNATLLDLACGPGNIIKYLLDRLPELQVLGTDLAPNMLTLAQKNNPTASFQLMDCRAVGKLDRCFDAIVCGFGLPYLTKGEATRMIADISTRLNPQGVVYLSTMEGEYAKSSCQSSSQDIDEELITYFHEEAYLTKALKDNNINVLDTSRIKYIDTKGKEVIDLVLIGKKT